jgi:hypothetical protein
MSFTLPTFNLMCNVWSSPNYPPAAPRLVVACNLAYSKRVHQDLAFGGFVPMQLLLPARTDVRSDVQVGISIADAVEVPAGSGRYYIIINVDDIGRGFANEHRCAVIRQSVVVNGPWAIPMP